MASAVVLSVSSAKRTTIIRPKKKIKEPEPEPIESLEEENFINNMTPEEKLAMLGLTVEDLKSLLWPLFNEVYL